MLAEKLCFTMKYILMFSSCERSISEFKELWVGIFELWPSYYIYNPVVADHESFLIDFSWIMCNQRLAAIQILEHFRVFIKQKTTNSKESLSDKDHNLSPRLFHGYNVEYCTIACPFVWTVVNLQSVCSLHHFANYTLVLVKLWGCPSRILNSFGIRV